MILPRLNILPDETMEIELYDLEKSESKPILKMESGESTFEVFYKLLDSFIVQYNCGYLYGSLQAENDYESILDDYEKIIKQLKDYLEEQS